MVHVSHRLLLSLVHVANHHADFFLVHSVINLPVLVDEAVHFEGFEDVLERAESLRRHSLHVLDEFENAVVFVILSLEVQIHHLVDELGAFVEEFHEIHLH